MWDGRIRANGHDITDKMPLTMAILKQQHEEQTMTQLTKADLEIYDDGVEREAHSKKGASSAERWMNCPGSSALIAAFELPETDEPDYRREGIALHEASADCLMRDIDAWEITGETYHETVMTPEMGEAVQVYIDRVRPLLIGPTKGRFHREHFFIEAKLAAPEIHEAMFGSVDWGCIVTPTMAMPMTNLPIMAELEGFLDVTDLKGGEGIVVEPDNNPQMMYYAFMLIATHYAELDDDFPVRLTIVQPRAFHHEGPVREWWTTVGDIKRWVVRELLPAMNSTDDELQAGKWCRFCPAKLACPMLQSLFRAAASYDPKEVVPLTSEALGLSYEKTEAVKFYMKALEEEVYRRMMAGKTVPHTKLVNKKANRIFSPTVTMKVEGKDVEVPVLEAATKLFGKAAFTAPELKSPAELSKINSAASDFVKTNAFMPTTGLTVALEGDKRTGIKVQSAQERFGAALANETAEV